MLGSQGGGIDFVRFGDSAVPPAGGAVWGGVNPLSPHSAQSLARSADGRDTDEGCDWCAQASSMGTANPGCVQPQIHVTPLKLQEVLYPGQVITRTVTISNSGPVTLVFQIDQSLTGCLGSGLQPGLADASLVSDEDRTGLGLDDVSWLRAMPMSGTVSSLAQVNVAVVLDAAGLPLGDHVVDLYIHSNDAGNTPLIVPVTLDVYSLLYLPLVLSAGP